MPTDNYTWGMYKDSRPEAGLSPESGEAGNILFQ
jgi:hypothetical protein